MNWAGIAKFMWCPGSVRLACRVPGIGHRIKSKDNRDKRVELLQRWVASGW